MKRTKKQFTVDRIVPESEGNYNIKVGIHLLLSLLSVLAVWVYCMQRGMSIRRYRQLVYLLMIATLVCCVLSQRKREKQWMKAFYYGGPWLLVLILTGFHGYWTGAKVGLTWSYVLEWSTRWWCGIAFRFAGNAAMQSFTLLMVIFCAQFCWWMVKDRKWSVALDTVWHGRCLHWWQVCFNHIWACCFWSD